MVPVDILLLIAACFMESGAAAIFFAPILAPVLTILGVHPLHLGFVFVFHLFIGIINSPLEICLFMGLTIPGVSLENLYQAICPFIVMLVAVLLLFSYVPGISMAVH